MERADIGVIGLGVMGENLILNINDHGFVVSCWNRTTSKVGDFLNSKAVGTKVIGFVDINEFISSLKSPKRVLLMINAGSGVDILIEQLASLLNSGDIIIDGGNSHFEDSERRCKSLKEKGMLFIGVGISGGEVGARNGPSMSVGGNKEAWPHIKNIIYSIAAKTDSGEICADWVGVGGCGHFVKMVHNGIEYGDMQLICEAYDLLHRLLNYNNDEISNIFVKWGSEKLSSYLIEIASKILKFKDLDCEYLIDKILDVAGQKGTGKWAVKVACDNGISASIISEAVFSRYLSTMKEMRGKMSLSFKDDQIDFTGDRDKSVEDIYNALFFAKIINYTQGYMLIDEVSKSYGWNLDLGLIALIWQSGCIIRSGFLKDIKKAYDKNKELPLLIEDKYFKCGITNSLHGLRETLLKSIKYSIPTPCMSAALSWFDSIRSKNLPANLIQAMRDYFGAHTYQRTDQLPSKFFHTNWDVQ